MVITTIIIVSRYMNTPKIAGKFSAFYTVIRRGLREVRSGREGWRMEDGGNGKG